MEKSQARLGLRVRFRYAEGQWTPTGFNATGQILYKHGFIERLPVEDDREAAIIRLDDGDATRISVVSLEDLGTTQGGYFPDQINDFWHHGRSWRSRKANLFFFALQHNTSLRYPIVWRFSSRVRRDAWVQSLEDNRPWVSREAVPASHAEARRVAKGRLSVYFVDGDRWGTMNRWGFHVS